MARIKKNKVLSTFDDIQIGKINKIYAGFLKEAFTVADKFGVSCEKFKKKFYFYIRVFLISSFLSLKKVPMDLSVKAKATMLGALFLIVNIFFLLNIEIKDHYSN